MKILFIYPNAEGYGRIPLGLSLVMTCLLNEGHKIDLFDTTFIRGKGHEENIVREKTGFVAPIDLSSLYESHTQEEINEMLRQELQAFSPDLVAISIVEQNYRYADRLLKVVKSFDRHIPVIAGGTTPTVAPQMVIENPRIDYACQGEGEETMVEVCGLMQRDRAIEPVHNIWSKQKGKVWNQPLRPLVDLDTLPIQNLDMWDARHHLKPYVGGLWRAGYFELSRGCPNNCSYCLHATCRRIYEGCAQKYYYRQKKIENLIREVKALNEKYDFEIIFFTDDCFLLMSKGRLDEFAEAWVSEIKLPFWVNTTPETITRGKLQKLKKAGCHGIGIGIESGSEWVRASVLNRPRITNAELVEKFRLVAEAEIRVTANNIIGSPYENELDIFETVELNRIIKPASLDATFMAPYIGTGIYDIAKREGYIETYKVPGFRGMAKGTTMRNTPSMRMPQISKRRLMNIRNRFTEYVYGDKHEKG